MKLNLRAEVDSLTVQKAIVGTGQAFTILSHGAIQPELAAGTLQACRIIDPTVSRTVALAAAIGSSDSQACNAMAKLTLEIARGLVATGVWRGRIDAGNG